MNLKSILHVHVCVRIRALPSAQGHNLLDLRELITFVEVDWVKNASQVNTPPSVLKEERRRWPLPRMSRAAQQVETHPLPQKTAY